MKKLYRIIFIISGLLTATMIYYTIFPQTLLSQLSIDHTNELSLFIIRSWSFLIFTLGCLMIKTGFSMVNAKPIVLMIGMSKAFFVALLILNYDMIGLPSLSVIIVDGLSVCLYLVFLLFYREDKLEQST